MKYTFEPEWLGQQAAGNPLDARHAISQSEGLANVNLDNLRELSGLLGVPEGVLARQPLETRRLLLGRKLSGMPRLASWAGGSAVNGALARDNVEWLEPVGRSFLSFANGVRAANVWQHLPGGGERFREHGPVLNVVKDFANGWLDLLRNMTAAASSVADLTDGRGSVLSAWFQRGLKEMDSWELERRKPESFLGQLGQDVARNAPQLMAQAATWIFARPLSVAFMGAHIYGGDYRRHVEAGISPENAAFAASVDAALQTVLETFGMRGLMSIAGKGGWKGMLGAAVGGAAKEGATEAMQHAPEYLTDFWARSSLEHDSMADRAGWTLRQALDLGNLAQGTKDALYEGLVGAILGGPLASVNAWRARNLSPEARNLNREQGERARGASQRLVLQQAMDEARQQLAQAPASADFSGLSAMLESTLPEDMRQVWIRPEDISSLLAAHPNDANLVLQALDQDVDTVNEALFNGMPIAASLPHILASREDISGPLSRAARLDPEGPDQLEATRYDPERDLSSLERVFNQDDDLADFSESERVTEAARQLQARNSRMSQIQRQLTRIHRQLVAAGMSEIEASTNTRLLESHVLTYWKNFGMDPVTWLNSLHVGESLPEDAAIPDEPAFDMGDHDLPLLPGSEYTRPGVAMPEYDPHAAPRPDGEQATPEPAPEAAPEPPATLDPNNLDFSNPDIAAAFEEALNSMQFEGENHTADFSGDNAGDNPNAADAMPENMDASGFETLPDNFMDQFAAENQPSIGSPVDSAENAPLNAPGMSTEPASIDNNATDSPAGTPTDFSHENHQAGERDAEEARLAAEWAREEDARVNGGNPREFHMADSVLRGQTSISRAGRLVRLFQQRNASTFAHEAFHIFTDDLIHVVAGGHQTALATLRREVSRLPDQDLLAGIRQAIGDLDGHPDPASGLGDLAANISRQIRERRKFIDELAKKLEKDPGNYNFYMARVNLQENIILAAGRASRLVRQAQRHLQAVEYARQDLQALAEFADIQDLDQILAQPDQAGQSLSRLQETTARAAEQYLMQGQAPSTRLADVFGRFKAWLLRVYGDAMQLLGKRINPRVSAVFDRMLATERDIAARTGLADLDSRERLFLNDEKLLAHERKELEDMANRIALETSGRLDRANRKKRERFRKERERQIYESLADDPFWQLAENARLDRAEVEAILGPQATAALLAASPRLAGKNNVTDVDTAAVQYGFENASQMLQALYTRLAVNRESRRATARLAADAEVAQMEQEDLEQAAALGCDAMGKYLDKMDQCMAAMAARAHLHTRREIERWADHSRTPRQLVAAQAMQKLSQMPLREISTARFQTMLKQALARRDACLASPRAEDVMRALNEVNDARVANEMIELAAHYQKKAAKIRQHARRICQRKPGFFAAAQTEALRKLLAAYGLGSMRVPEDLAWSRLSLSELMQQILGDGDAGAILPTLPEWALKLEHPRNDSKSGPFKFNDLTPFEMEELDSFIKMLEKGGRQDSKTSQAELERHIANVAINCAAKMRQLPPEPNRPPDSPMTRASRIMEGCAAKTDILLWEFRKADGLDNILGEGAPGDMELLWRRFIDADERVRSWNDKLARSLAPHFAQLERCRQRLEKAYGRDLNLEGARPPAIWSNAHHADKFNAEMVFAIALNLGNASNIQRLMSGYGGENGLTYESMATLFGDSVAQHVWRAAGLDWQIPTGRQGIFTAEDWQAIQGIWDSLALLWPDTVNAHVKLFNAAPVTVGATPMRIFNLPGSDRPVTLRGGYYPARYDSRVSEKVAAWTEREDLLSRNDSLFNKPTAKKGHTVTRARRAPRLPMRLDLSAIPEHISDAVRFIEYGYLVRLADRITQNPEFAAAYRETYGDADYNAIRPNLRGLVRPEKISDILPQLERKARKFLVPWSLGFNPNVALLQATAIFPAMTDLGVPHVLRSLAYISTHGMDALREIWDASPYMLSRMRNLDQDIQRGLAKLEPGRQLTLKIGKHEFTWDNVVDCGMWGIVAVDAVAAGTVWHAAYQKKLAELRSQEAGTPAENATSPAPPATDTPADATADNRGESQPAAHFGDSMSRDLLHLLNDQRREIRDKLASLNQNNSDASQNMDGENGSQPADNGSTGEPAEESRTDSAPGRRFRINLNPLSVFRPLTRNLYQRDKKGKLMDRESRWHEQARIYADTIVKQSNPDFDATSRSAFLRDNAMGRLLNQFSSATTLLASRNAMINTARRKGKMPVSRVMRYNFLDYILPAVSLCLIYGALQDWGDKRDKPEDMYGFVLGRFLDQLSMKIPMFGSLLPALAGPALGHNSYTRGGGLRTSLDAPVDIAQGLSHAAGLIWAKKATDEQKKAAIYSLGDAMSFTLRVPISKIIKRADRGYQQYRENRGTPFNIILPRPGK